MGQFLTTSTIFMCPHGGTAVVVSTNTRVQAGGAFVVRSSDIFTIAGCALSASTPPTPCLTIQWIVPALQNSVMQDFVLTTDSVGLCIGSPTPAPPIVIPTQFSVSGL